MTHTLVLHGNLREYGERFELSAYSAKGLINLLERQIRGLRELIKKGKFQVFINGREVDNSMDNGRYIELDLPLGETHKEVHLIPVLEGSGGDNAGVGKIIVGAIITVAAIAAAPITGGTSIAAAMGTSTSLLGISYGTFALIGVSMMLSGVSQLIAPKVQSESDEDQKPSYFISGTINMANENGAIPIAYGECFVGSHILNAGLFNVDLLTPYNINKSCDDVVYMYYNLLEQGFTQEKTLEECYRVYGESYAYDCLYWILNPPDTGGSGNNGGEGMQ